MMLTCEQTASDGRYKGMAEPTAKTCKRCERQLFRADFRAQHNVCKDCMYAATNARRKAARRGTDREAILTKGRANHWRKYGASRADINAQIAKQGGCCAICRDALKCGRRQHVDHDHAKPGTFRGVLCAPCNTGLGALRDDPALIVRAIAYVQNGGAR